ncbi:alpha-L-fucosidase [Leifsonia sp. NPDC058230]|uniref:alpha-L-fucosidase n=1 Tax=Leifsonia sp. NPDC058230 TaxID=3346391 RepID=UPI0036D79D24
MTTDAVDSFIRTRTSNVPGDGWFENAGLGMFIHWDHASQQGLEISWAMTGYYPIERFRDRVTIATYQSSAATFDPESWDAARVAKLARDAGARYVVFTTRHHAGYSMFSSQYSGFGVGTSPSGRDVTRELVDALRAEGIRIGFYYSLSDWHHPDYPALEEDDLPYALERWPLAGQLEHAGTPLADDRHRRPSAESWDRYREYLRGQLTELLTNYGQIDLLWFDGEWERSPEEWDVDGLHDLIRSLQPNVVINDRLLGHGDYVTPEQGLPRDVPDGPWELCLTIGEVWGSVPGDTMHKTATSLITTLTEARSRGGNLLLNLSPTGDGSLDHRQVDAFEQIAEWMTRHRESVHNVSPTVGVDFYGPTTAKPGRLYLHLVMRPIEEIIVRGIPVDRIRRVTLLADGRELAYSTVDDVHDVTASATGELRIPAPEPSAALIDVIAIEFE